MTFRPNAAGFAELDRGLARFERTVADRIADRARATVAVRTGETRDSIKVEDLDGHVAVTVGGAGLLLELGTATMNAEPFLQPAADDVTREIPGIARDELGAVR